MNRDEYLALLQTAQKRNAALYGWLRYLVGLASGSLAVLVSLSGTGTPGSMAALCMRGCWISLGLGILLGASALYGEVWLARALVKRLLELDRSRSCGDTTGAGLPPAAVALPEPFSRCEQGCYLALLVAVGFLIGFAILS